MLQWLLLLFIGVPILELYLLFQIGTVIGVMPTIGIVVLTGVLGSWLARREGRKTLISIREKLRSGSVPSDPLLDGLMILVAGALLITPGVLTDVVGFCGLIPWTRSLVRTHLKNWFRKLTETGAAEFRYFGSFGGSQTPNEDPSDHNRKRSPDGVDYDIDVGSTEKNDKDNDGTDPGKRRQSDGEGK